MTTTPAVPSAPGPGAELELVDRCRGGDRAAWRDLYHRHVAMVHRFVAAMGLPPAEREDACQEVFLAVHRSLGRFRGEARLSSWIYRIAAREAMRSDRRRKLHGLIGTLLMREPPPAPAPDPSERAAALAVLDGLLARLSPRKRMVLVLAEIEEVPVPEIARIAGCPVNTVWSRLHHARRDLVKMARRRKP